MLGLKTGVCVLNKTIVYSKVDILRYYVKRMYRTKVLSLVNDQTDAQIFSMYLFLFVTLYMFRAHRAHLQGRQIV